MDYIKMPKPEFLNMIGQRISAYHVAQGATEDYFGKPLEDAEKDQVAQDAYSAMVTDIGQTFALLLAYARE